jgi:alkanesulfonate monooxygenase SsuD/methylene tetrahydromethanopterin reductase-like flavin-dependent oxidoreductase (luciferase family)
VRYAVNLPPFGPFADPAAVLDLATAAEEAGWDGLFPWDHVVRAHEPHRAEVADPWILLAAVAAVTDRIRLGPMVTPLARRRPQKLAREAVTLDHLSRGRLTIGVGLGSNGGKELERFGEETDTKARAAIYDEALGLVQELWSGEEVDHHGPHFTARQVRFLPRPLQQPRIPLWGAALGRSRGRPVRRAARLDGLFPVETTLDQLDAMLEVVADERGGLDGYDVVMEVGVDADPDEFAAHGVTWAMRVVDDRASAGDVIRAVADGPTGSLATFVP